MRLIRQENREEDFLMDSIKYDKKRVIHAHASMFGACAFWGLMAPVGKAAMNGAIDGIDMVAFRIAGGALLFWFFSLFGKQEHVPWRDRLMFIGAAVFGLVCNQCCFTIGLSITSPVNASIVTTSMPVFAMIMSALILKEPITTMKAGGVALGCMGAVILVLTSAASADAKVGDLRGDLLCVCAQLSYALYLSLFNPLVRRYSTITINKWMFLWAAVLLLPFCAPHVAKTDFSAVTAANWLEIGYVVVIGTFVCYLLMMIGQRTLRPTVVSSYNYLQPVVSVAVSVAAGLSILRPSQVMAVVLVALGVYMVSKSRSKRDSMTSDADKAQE